MASTGSASASRQVKDDSKAEVKEFKNAAKECKAERAADPQAFHATYGTGHNGRNALGKCVSRRATETRSSRSSGARAVAERTDHAPHRHEDPFGGAA